MLKSYNSTIKACFMGYIVQGIVNNFAPLLFLTLQSEFNIPLAQITALITVNFFLQLCVDLASAFLIDKIGYRASALIAHFFAAAGLISMTVLPSVLPDPFIGLLISVVLYAIGGGFLEVIISPIVESCPSENKTKTMSLLHSFYCWGSVGVVAISSLLFTALGITRWRIVALIWAAVPIANAALFFFVPLRPLISNGEKSTPIPKLLKSRVFIAMAIIILCAGAAEAAVAQWSSAFVESALGVKKEIGDLVGPTLFAACMGLSRLIYGKKGDKIKLYGMMTASGILCVISYLIMALTPSSIAALIAMGLSGFSVGILWPGTYSLASKAIKNGGNAMFALLALAGDLGCMLGPTVIGFASECLGGSLKAGLLIAVIFPAILTVSLLIGLLLKRKRGKSAKNKSEESLSEN